MRRMLNVFFDTEFTGLHQDTDLISVGCFEPLSNKMFYGILNDYDKSKVDKFVEENVLKPINDEITKCGINIEDFTIYKSSLTMCRGNTESIAEKLRTWLKDLSDEFEREIQFVSDVCHYDFVLLIDLLSTDMIMKKNKSVFKIPSFISPYCHDINQDIADYLNITDREAFDYSREEFISNYCPCGMSMYNEVANIISFSKHNALYDAITVAEINNFIRDTVIRRNKDE